MPIDGAEIKASISNGVARLDKAEANSAKYKIWLSGIASYVGRGLALSGGVVQPDQAATQTNVQGPNQSSFFVGGTWSTPFISPISRGVSGE